MSLLIAGIFLISTSGYVMYKTNCSCIGEEQTSVFVKPDSCEDDFHKHHKHNENNSEIACSEHQCHDCNDHEKECGCETPEFFFFKLKEKAVDDEAKFIWVVAPVISIASIDILMDYSIENDKLEDEVFYADPPPKITSPLDFLISIQQLKIPSLA